MNVYDFDNTIYKGESVIDFFFYFMKRDPKLVAYLPKVFVALLKYKARKITINQALDEYGTLVEEYCRGIENLQEDITKFWDTHICKIKPFYADIKRDDDVILSAGFDIVLEEMGKRMNIRNIISTETDRDEFRIVNFCFRENKVKMFRKYYPDAVIENFYTDSLNDRPIIDLAQNAYLVRGNKITKIK